MEQPGKTELSRCFGSNAVKMVESLFILELSVFRFLLEPGQTWEALLICSKRMNALQVGEIEGLIPGDDMWAALSGGSCELSGKACWCPCYPACVLLQEQRCSGCQALLAFLSAWIILAPGDLFLPTCNHCLEDSRITRVSFHIVSTFVCPKLI